VKRNIIKLFLFLGLFVFSSSVYAEKLTCSDYEEMQHDISELIDDLDRVHNINEGDEIDKALGIVVDTMQLVLDYERDARFHRAVSKLSKGYADMNRELFEEGLDTILDSIERLYDRDCSRKMGWVNLD